MDVLRLEDVWKVYTNGVSYTALKGVSISIEEGEFVAVVGPSGSGKSTLLHIMGLLDTPTKGKVYLLGKDVSTLDEDSRALLRRKHIGFVFQSFNLVPFLSALENVMLPLILDGKDEDEARRRALMLLKEVGLENKADNLPNQLSGGQQQRVAIARALANDPEIILADEPTGNLDSATGERILKLFEELNKRGKTLVVVTHDEEVASAAERIVRIRDGEVV